MSEPKTSFRRMPGEWMNEPAVLIVELRASEALPYKVKIQHNPPGKYTPYSKYGIVSCLGCGRLFSLDAKQCITCGEINNS